MEMTLVPSNESKDTLKMHEELWTKFRDLIRPITNTLDKEKYMKIKFNLDDEYPLKKTLTPFNMIIFVTSVFHGGKR